MLQVAGIGTPDLVVDLGCGTGLSTGIWADRARRVIGIEPLDEMRAIAEASTDSAKVRWEGGVAQRTGLPNGAADVVTCSQSLHDMEPESTLAEIGRILRPGGVFAAYDYDWPPVVHREAEEALFAFVERVGAVRREHGIRSAMQQWDKDEHATRMEKSGVFGYVREIVLHHTEACTAERWVGFALTLGHVPSVLELGLPERELGLDRLRAVAERALGTRGLPWHVSYRLRLGIT